MEPSRFDSFLGTRWADTGASFLQLAGPDAVLLVTAPPRDTHEITGTSRILRVSWDPDLEKVVVLLSHR